MANTLTVKKFGHQVQAWIDPTTDQLYSVKSFDEQCPDHLFPYTVNIEAFLSNVRGKYDLNYIERPEAALPIAKRVKATEADLKGVERALGQSVPPSAPNTAAGYIPPLDDGNQVIERIMKHVETYLVKLSVAEGRKHKVLVEEYQIVKKFVLKLFPALYERISVLEEQYENGE